MVTRAATVGKFTLCIAHHEISCAAAALDLNPCAAHYFAPASGTVLESLRSARFAQFHGAGEIDRDELRHPALGHGDAVEPVHARHGDRVMRDDDKARIGRAVHLVEQIAEALDIVVVERGIYL